LLSATENRNRPTQSWNISARSRSFMRLSRTQHALLLEAASLLILARASIAFLPFRRLVQTTGLCVSPQNTVQTETARDLSPAAASMVLRVRWAVRCAAKHLPFTFICFPRAIAANWMLRRRKLRPVLHLGTKLSSNAGLQAHAWLDCAGIPVTGYPLTADFCEVAMFL